MTPEEEDLKRSKEDAVRFKIELIKLHIDRIIKGLELIKEELK